MPTEQSQQALKAALQSYRIVVVAFKSVDRVVWADRQISLVGSAEQVSEPEHWDIYEHSLIRDANAKIVEALELYRQQPGA